jgi:hypothetical protein
MLRVRAGLAPDDRRRGEIHALAASVTDLPLLSISSCCRYAGSRASR